MENEKDESPGGAPAPGETNPRHDRDGRPVPNRHLLIHGLVQGVGFRWSLCAEARRLGVAGWVRNRRDGCVEALLQGSPEALATLTAWAHRGPPDARVSAVDIADETGTGTTEALSDFSQRPTV